MRSIEHLGYLGVMYRIAFVVVALAACGRDTDDNAVSEQRCERLRDHVVDVRLASATGVEREPHRRAMRQALGKDFVSSCVGSLTDAQVQCALKAPDSAAIAACQAAVAQR